MAKAKGPGGVRELAVRVESIGSDGRNQATTAVLYEADTGATAALILGHGAGAGQRSPFMASFARGLAGLGLDVVTFDFLYVQQKRRLPDKREVLEACYASVIHQVRTAVASATRGLFIGGKSMGGRIATQVAAAHHELPIAGLVLLGYPLHPPGRPEHRRDAHLPQVRRPMLFVQGSRDAFGTPAELEPVLAPLSPRPTLHVVENGDHSLKVRRSTPAGQATVYADVQRVIKAWIAKQPRR
jgi:predicted alpha/beta-hydrolase family hydrolase